MKLHRLLTIITYLLNHDLVTAKHLAQRLEVSERTIQRDVDTINLAGIPITAVRGSNGGYKILDTYKLSKQTATEKDIETILMGLSSLSSALEDNSISDTLEKIMSISSVKTPASIDVDFGVAKENSRIVEYIRVIDQAIKSKCSIELAYTNLNNHTTRRIVEPILLKFKWYSWYLTAYCTEKNDYRIFKLIRITDIKQTSIKFSREHDNNPKLFDDLISNNDKEAFTVLFKGRIEILTAVLEYMPGVKLIEKTGDHFSAEISVFERERMWFAFLLSFGNDISVIEPKHLQQRLVEHSQKIIKTYETTI